MNSRIQRFIPVGFAILALGLGFWGYAVAGSGFSPETAGSSFPPYTPATDYSSAVHSIFTLTWLGAVHCFFSAIGLIRFYDLFQPHKDPWQLVIAQFAVPGVALVSAARLFLVGVRKNLRNAMARHKTNHTVVCGVGDVGMQVIQNLRGAGHSVVGIDLQEDSTYAATCEKCNVPLLHGDAKISQVLEAAGAHRAKTVIVSTGSDAENMAIALQVKALRERRSIFGRSRVQVLSEVRNDWMHKRLIGSDKSSLGSAAAEVRLFNPFANAARMLIRRLRIPPIPEFEAVTFVIVGFGAYGREMALHLIRAAPVALGRTLHLLVFDEQADQARENFPVTQADAAQMASVEFIAAVVTPASADVRQVIERRLESAGPLLGVALALGDDEVSLSAALEMRSLLDRVGRLHVPIYVRLEHYRQLGDMLEIESIARFESRLQIFGTLEETLGAEVLLGSQLDAFAQELHKDYLDSPPDQINPQANVPWHDLPEFMKMSNRWRADHTPLLLQLAGVQAVENAESPAVLELTSEQIELLAQLEYRRYVIERHLAGSRRSAHTAEWSALGKGEKDWNRQSVAKLPKIMAGLGIELRPVHAVRLYGEHLAGAAERLEQFLSGTQSGQPLLIADLDDAEAVRAAGRALALPSMSLWLFSCEEPREFFERKASGGETERSVLIHRANGWARRERMTMEAQAAPQPGCEGKG